MASNSPQSFVVAPLEEGISTDFLSNRNMLERDSNN